MTTDSTRIRAVANALRGIRNRVTEDDDRDHWDSAAFDKWLGMLEGALDGPVEDLLLDDSAMDRSDFLLHLDAAIAFLETYETSQSNVTTLKPRGVF